MTTGTPLQYLAALVGYLSHPKAKHGAAIEQELLDLVREIDPSPPVAYKVVSSNHHEAISIYIDRFGSDAFKEFDISVAGPKRTPLDLLDYATLEDGKLIRLVQLIAPYDSTHPGGIAQKLLRKATQENRLSLILPLWDAAGISDELRDETWLAMQLHSTQCDIVARWAKSYPHNGFKLPLGSWEFLVKSRHEPTVILSIALAFANRIDIRSALKIFEHPTSGEWKARLQRNTLSSHGIMEVVSRLPSIDELLSMETKEIIPLIAGTSKRQEKRMRNKAKRKADYAAKAALEETKKENTP